MSILLLFIFPILLFAKEPLDAGSKFLNFEINRATLISGGYFLQDWLVIQAGIGFAVNRETETNGFAVKLGVDQYLDAGKISPFAGGYVRFDINPDAFGETYWEGSRFVFGGHWGLTYFLLQDLSITGTIGTEFQFNSPKNMDSSTNFTTFTSGVQIRFYF